MSKDLTCPLSLSQFVCLLVLRSRDVLIFIHVMLLRDLWAGRGGMLYVALITSAVETQA